MALGERVRLARQIAGMTQEELASRVGVTQTAIYNLEKRDSESSRNAGGLAAALGVRLEWLLFGEEPMKDQASELSPAKQESNAVETELALVETESDEWDRSEFCYLDKLDVMVRGGNGETGTIEVVQKRLPMMRSTLRAAGVSPEAAKLAEVTGDSMVPYAFHGDTVGINTLDKWPIKDGKVYAFRDTDLLRVKMLERRPGGGLKISSYNPAYPPEELTGEEVKERVEIIGRVFWRSSVDY